jgi:hypothetical protein
MTTHHLQQQISGAEARMQDLDAQINALPQGPHRQRVRHAREAAGEALRRMRTELAGRPPLCPACQADKPASFFVCRPCWREAPFKLRALYHGAVGLHHHGKVDAAHLQRAGTAILSHLKQFSSALV